jgi:hypothetical protein
MHQPDLDPALVRPSATVGPLFRRALGPDIGIGVDSFHALVSQSRHAQFVQVCQASSHRSDLQRFR